MFIFIHICYFYELQFTAYKYLGLLAVFINL
jgi:hypothetical protein